MARPLTGTGLQYLRARYYDPQTGRFLSRDPLPGGHPYAYAGNNPVRYVDPSGMCHETLGSDALCRMSHHWERPKEGSSFDPNAGVECDYEQYLIVNGVCRNLCPEGWLVCGPSDEKQPWDYAGDLYHALDEDDRRLPPSDDECPVYASLWCGIEFFFIENPDCGFNLVYSGVIGYAILQSDGSLIVVYGETGVQTAMDAIEACNNAGRPR